MGFVAKKWEKPQLLQISTLNTNSTCADLTPAKLEGANDALSITTCQS
jgi:hypothetical protein